MCLRKDTVSESLRNQKRNFLLNLEGIIQLPIVTFRPQAAPVFRLIRLNSNSQPAAVFSDASFDHHPNIEVAANSSNINIGAFEPESRGSRG